jgi:hypothetical protein
MLTNSAPNNSALGSSNTTRVHVVTVGKGAHRFDPETLTASAGDVVTFEFFPLNHSVVRAQYRFPCIPYEDVVVGQAGFFSGLIPVSEISNDVRGDPSLQVLRAIWLTKCLSLLSGTSRLTTRALYSSIVPRLARALTIRWSVLSIQ